MNIYLVRHGETEKNTLKKYYGNLDVGLNEKGKMQCEYLREKLRNIELDKVYTSEMKRAIETANIILQDREYKITKDNRLNEMNMGDFEGKDHKELEKLYPKEWNAWCEDWKECSPPKGESYKTFYYRVKEFIEDVLKEEVENILIVAHGGVIKSIYTYILGEDFDIFWKVSSRNGELSLIKYEYGNLYLEFKIPAGF
ncbi:alpha-ribazole phosphatase [Clostridium tetani]|uniref:Alpha-ribazole phosphatase n=1 Tax=Clostridium tetani (strain Massachusetts / E88) TaxID=212717 RepID=Q897L7_CLOTE|nr:alpha-ribazole phosphatase [Clostridium tetani]AAO35319.1 alpha-ribazole-5-phosphate phosphatase [Clostridium tetani E88]AVP55863.1 alpha-ribazole phosphatase [Clostridium tetani]KGI41398.1 alpha-ribazole phosphatase [Clostridium tetani]KGI46474.1 alpha-ribazole phosphatase [Clostridium tetani]KHO36833.1 alpha-ribazole phosphatase [Clostridium tetani]